MSEIYKSELENSSTLGAEYYAPEYLNPYKRLQQSALEKKSLREICSLITDGDHGSADYAQDGVVFVLSEAVKVGWIDSQACRRITPAHAAMLGRSKLVAGDVLVSKTGAYFGHSAVVSGEFVGANTIAHVGVLRPRRGNDPFFMSTFFNSRYGYSQLRRRGIKTTRPEIKLLEFFDISVPIVSANFSNSIREAVLKAGSVRESCDALSAEAERSMLSSMGLNGWKAVEPLSCVHNLNDVFTAGRLDAEHFRPKYAQLVELIRSTKQHAWLGDLLSANQRGKQPEYVEKGRVVVNSKHVSQGEVCVDGDNRMGEPVEDGLFIEAGDVLMNGTGVGTIGRAAPYLHEFKAIPDNHVTILRSKAGAIDPVYLSVFLNSVAGQLQVEQRLRGSSGQIELYPNDIAQFSVWVAPPAIQQQVRQAVENGLQAKQNAKRLLDAAKRAVEVAIEESEAAALAYLQQATTAGEAGVAA